MDGAMIDLSTLTRLYGEMCALWRTKPRTDAYWTACDLFLAHARYLQAKASGDDLRAFNGLILRWSADAPRWPHEMACAKIAYISRAEARLVATSVKARRGGRQDAYKCPHCEFWHLTSTSRKEYKRRIADFNSKRAEDRQTEVR